MSILGNPVCLPIGGKAAKGSQMFMAVTLPHSIYYEQAAEWLKIKDNPKAEVPEISWGGQVVCGGNLWEIYGNAAYCYSLENGELLETVPLTGIENYSSLAITTDGVSRIWIVKLSMEGRNLNDSSYAVGSYTHYYQKIVLDSMIFLYEFDIMSKSVKKLYQSLQPNLGRSERSRNYYYDNVNVAFNSSSVHRTGIIGYSARTNCVYFGKIYINSVFRLSGKYSYNSSWTSTSENLNVNGTSSTMFAYNLASNTCTQIASHPYNDAYTGQYFYDDGDFFYVGNGYIDANKSKRISRYNKQSNIWETISANFEGYTVGPFSYVQIGDKMLQISKTATGIFDPKTGNLETLSVPVIPPDNMVMYPGFKAFSNNVLYLVTPQGVYKCPFFSAVPEDAPIVCKIYKGQKYHTLEPFEIPGKLSLTRTQQIAQNDIEIKMYEYSSEGGQTVYIEDTGEV